MEREQKGADGDRKRTTKTAGRAGEESDRVYIRTRRGWYEWEDTRRRGALMYTGKNI